MTCLDGLAFPGQALSSLPYMGTHRNLTALSMPLEDGSATQMALLGPCWPGPGANHESSELALNGQRPTWDTHTSWTHAKKADGGEATARAALAGLRWTLIRATRPLLSHFVVHPFAPAHPTWTERGGGDSAQASCSMGASHAMGTSHGRISLDGAILLGQRKGTAVSMWPWVPSPDPYKSFEARSQVRSPKSQMWRAATSADTLPIRCFQIQCRDMTSKLGIGRTA